MTDIVPTPNRGDTFKRRFTVKPASGTLAGCLVKFTIKKSWKDRAIVLQATTVNDKIVVVDAVVGLIEVTFTKEEMAKLDPDVDYEYDIEVTDGVGARFSKPRNIFRVSGDVS